MATGVTLLATGTSLASGWGLVVDALVVFVVGWLVLFIAAGLLLVVGRALRGVPVRLRALVATALVLTAGPFFAAGWYALAISAVLLAGGALAGAGLASLYAPRPSGRLGMVFAIGSAVAGVALLSVVTVWLASGGWVDDGTAPRPGGDLAVDTFTYGSGDDPRRAHYGDRVDVRTDAVDGTRLLASWAGWRGALRSRYWGFGPEALPRNATVWYPRVDGRFPLVLIVHGNVPMELPSDEGYAWLAHDLASRGYVVASVDQNFLNDSRARGGDLGDETDARAWLLLEHLRLWRDWQAGPTHPAHARVDLDRVALIGHSRGGEAVATAAAFDLLARYPEDAAVAFDAGFGIDAVVALSPSPELYRPAGHPTDLTDVSYLTLQGGMDGDHLAFHGLRQYQRTTFTGDTPGVKAAVYLPGANHGQFNTVWGRQDLGGLVGRVLNTAAIMPPSTQRAAARTAIVGFLDATLHGDTTGLAPLVDPAHTDWPAGADPVTRFADHTEVTIAGFDEDPDPGTGTLPGTTITGERLGRWLETPMPQGAGEQGTNAALLEWVTRAQRDAPTYTLHLPPDLGHLPDTVITLTIADGRGGRIRRALDLTIEVVNREGSARRTTLAELGGLPPAQRPRRFKPPLPASLSPTEPIGQTFRLPLTPGGAPSAAALREIRLIFDQSRAGKLYVEHIAIARAETAAELTSENRGPWAVTRRRFQPISRRPPDRRDAVETRPNPIAAAAGPP